ncbi:MAG TPA: hypothetical protein VF883_16365 [Thermoanaerobaculia bacterium]|jgi:hypothetical protein
MTPPTITIEYPEPVYSLFDTSRSGLPAVVVVNAALREFAHRDVFPWHLSVIVEAVELAGRGMPTRGETLILDTVDDRIDSAVLDTRTPSFLLVRHGMVSVSYSFESTTRKSRPEPCERSWIAKNRLANGSFECGATLTGPKLRRIWRFSTRPGVAPNSALHRTLNRAA